VNFGDTTPARFDAYLETVDAIHKMTVFFCIRSLGRKLMHRTNVELDEKLVKEGMRLFNKRTKKELIHFALSELIRREKAKGILDLEGKVQWEGDLKEMRNARFPDTR
jgi:Arc/MetJ family transcription regulator